MSHTSVSTIDDRGGSPRSWLLFALIAIVVGGIVYPALSVLINGTLFPQQATGSLIVVGGRALGSDLVAQPFVSPQYLIGRPSAADHDPTSVGGSNWAPSNPELRARVATDSAAISEREGAAAGAIPVDLVTASGSGIDPHLSPEAAEIQIERIARVRGMAPDDVRAIIALNTQGPQFGLLGKPRVNVLAVNLALDRMR